MDMEMTNVSMENGNKVKKGMSRAGLFFLIIILLEFPASIIVGLVQSQVSETAASLVSVLTVQGYLLVAAILFIIITKSSLTKDIRIRKFKITSFLLCLVLMGTAMPMANFLNLVSQLFVKNEVSGAIFNMTETLPAWACILIVGCMPGFTEEVIFRGIIHNSFRKRSVLTGIIVSALSFGLMHMNFNQIMYAVYLGIIFALVNEATGSLVSTMIMHMIFNGLNTALIFILPKLYEFLGQYSAEYANVNVEEMIAARPDKSTLIMAMGIYGPMAIAGLVFTFLLLKAIAHINGRELTWASITRVNEGCENVKPVNALVIVCWVICAGFATFSMIKGM